MSSATSSSINSAATALTASRITSACSSSNTFLTTSSIVILSAPATRRLLSSTPWNETTKDQRRVGRNHVPSDPDLHHATGRDHIEPLLEPQGRPPCEAGSECGELGEG